MKPHEFTVGTKFKYIGTQDGEPDEFANEIGVVREVLSIGNSFSDGTLFNGGNSVVISTGGIEFGIDSPYAKDCEIAPDNTPRLYTEAEVLEIERKAWEAARERTFINRPIHEGGGFYSNKYENLEDYKAK